MNGLAIGIIGLALAAILPGIGSSIGLKSTGSASAGVIGEDPSKYSKIMILTLLPATQGLYGFVIAIMGMTYLPGAVESAEALAQGWAVFGACMPMAILGMISAIQQGKSAGATIMSVGKKPEIGGKAILFPAMVEFYALLGLVTSIMLLGSIV